MNGRREEEDVNRMVEWAHERDGVVEVARKQRPARVIPYDEVARRLQERKKK